MSLNITTWFNKKKKWTNIKSWQRPLDVGFKDTRDTRADLEGQLMRLYHFDEDGE